MVQKKEKVNGRRKLIISKRISEKNCGIVVRELTSSRESCSDGSQVSHTA